MNTIQTNTAALGLPNLPDELNMRGLPLDVSTHRLQPRTFMLLLSLLLACAPDTTETGWEGYTLSATLVEACMVQIQLGCVCSVSSVYTDTAPDVYDNWDKGLCEGGQATAAEECAYLRDEPNDPYWLGVWNCENEIYMATCDYDAAYQTENVCTQ